jgi:predicted HicB family RNase H-like nuclease
MTAKHKGYAMGPVELDAETGMLSGTVAGLRDVVHFTGATGAELVQAFRDSIDDYLAFCAERGESPEKPYRGRLLVRLDPTLHREAAIQAAMEGLSLNAWIERQIEHAAGAPARGLWDRLTSEPATTALRYDKVLTIQSCCEALACEVEVLHEALTTAKSRFKEALAREVVPPSGPRSPSPNRRRPAAARVAAAGASRAKPEPR